LQVKLDLLQKINLTKMKTHLSFDVTLTTKGHVYRIEVTENYEGDKFHMVIFDDDKYEYEHVETIGAKNEKEFFAVLRKLENSEV